MVHALCTTGGRTELCWTFCSRECRDQFRDWFEAKTGKEFRPDIRGGHANRGKCCDRCNKREEEEDA